jgi:hypothetical protein
MPRVLSGGGPEGVEGQACWHASPHFVKIMRHALPGTVGVGENPCTGVVVDGREKWRCDTAHMTKQCDPVGARAWVPLCA